MLQKKSIVFLLLSLGFFSMLSGQQAPLNPVSYRIFSPMVLNPAITGCKDYTFINLTASIKKSSESQIISGHTRLLLPKSKGNSSLGKPVFTKIGFGGYLFNEVVDSYRNIGVSGSFAYHLPLSKKSLSHLSFGIAGKAIYGIEQSESSEVDSLSSGSNDYFIPNLDLGIYYYGPQFFAGLSATNILDTGINLGDSNTIEIPVSRQYFFITGYKFLISKKHAIVLEPSILIAIEDETNFDSFEYIHPSLKAYFHNFCLGTYYNIKGDWSFFMQYQFPRIYAGYYLEMPFDGSATWNNEKLILEFTVGMNLSKDRMRNRSRRYW